MSVLDRLPPHSIEAEQGVIGSILFDHERLHDVIAVLQPEDFYRDAHQVIWRAVQLEYAAGRKLDPTVLHDRLTQGGGLGTVDVAEYLGECYQSVPHSGFALQYAQVVREHSARRAVIDAANAMLAEAYGRQSTSADLIDRATRSLLDVGDDAQRGRGELRHLSEGISQAIEAIDARREGAPIGVETGLDALDEMICGLQGGTLTVIGARPGKGKSALAANILAHAAIEQRVPGLMFSLEMSQREFGERFLVSVGRMSGAHVKHPRKLDDVTFARFRRKLDAIATQGADAPIFIDDGCGRTVTEIIATTRRAIARHQIGLVVVDYLQLCESEHGRESRQEQVAKISRRLKTLARDAHIPVIALSQLNRLSEERADQVPRLADLRESGAIEQDADNVLLIHHPDRESDDAEIIVAKARNGPVGTVKVYFRRDQTRFETWYPPAAAPIQTVAPF